MCRPAGMLQPIGSKTEEGMSVKAFRLPLGAEERALAERQGVYSGLVSEGCFLLWHSDFYPRKAHNEREEVLRTEVKTHGVHLP